MAVLAVHEYQRIQCGDIFDTKNRIITASQHRSLERFAEDYKRRFKVQVFQHGPRRSLVAQNFVGIINLGCDQIEVLPKIESDTSQVRKNLAKMIASVLKLDLHGGSTSQVDKSNDSILEILIQLFCEQLWQAVRRGIVRKYEHQQENLTMLRGRLSISKQIKLNLARPDRLACEYDEFNENNLINQVLKTALQVLQRITRSGANQRNISELLFCFQDVDYVVPTCIQWHLVSIDRLNVRYKPIIKLARLFIEGMSPDVVSGGSDGFALLFDMNELFERYVGAVTQRVFGGTGMKVSLQGPRKHLATHSNGDPAFALKPDIVVSKGNAVEFIVDTKWKRLKEASYREGVASSDAYQMFAYSSKYLTSNVVLLYPHHTALGPWIPRRAEYCLNKDKTIGVDNFRHIGVSTIDLRDLDTVPDQLRQIFPDYGLLNKVSKNNIL